MAGGIPVGDSNYPPAQSSGQDADVLCRGSVAKGHEEFLLDQAELRLARKQRTATLRDAEVWLWGLLDYFVRAR
jgi:hypothetical protein